MKEAGTSGRHGELNRGIDEVEFQLEHPEKLKV